MITNMLYGGPFRDMRLLQEEVGRLAQRAAPQASFPGINVYAHQDAIVITAELPGVKENNLDITIHRDTVTLRGERQDEVEEAKAYHRRDAVGVTLFGASDFLFRLILTRWKRN